MKKSQHSKFSKPSKPIAAVELTVWSARKTALKFLKMGVPILPLGSKTDRPSGIGSVQYSVSWRPEDAAIFREARSLQLRRSLGSAFCIVRADGTAGIAAFRDLASRNESRIPKTVSWKIGDHRYYLFGHSDNSIPQTSTALAAGVELVGTAEYVLGPDSELSKDRKARFVADRRLGEVKVADAPSWLPMNANGREWLLRTPFPIRIDEIKDS